MIEKDPVVTALEFSQKIGKNVEDIRNILWWSVLAGVWILWLVVVCALQVSSGLFTWGKMSMVEAYIFGFTVILGGGIVAWGALFPVRYGWGLYKSLGEWDEGFKKFYYTFAVEGSVPKGKNPQEKILYVFQEAFPDIKNLIEKNPSIVKYDAKVQGKKAVHSFDIYSHLYTKGSKDFGELFIRRFEKETPVDKADLEEFRKAVEDVHEKHRRTTFRIIAVSPVSFTEEAMEYARNKKIWYTAAGFTPDLIEEKTGGYKVVWAGGKLV